MKAEAATKFCPITLTITFEVKEEAENFYRLFNISPITDSSKHIHSAPIRRALEMCGIAPHNIDPLFTEIKKRIDS